MALAPHSTASIAQSLSGIDFPASKNQLVEHAKKNKADQDILDVIQSMPDEKYTSMADVFKGVGMAEH
ncbi:MAG: DUF2795 domain-containing protein [Rhodospirillales bacterium]|nr:DUF2795 domain-containing protein [Rhodospirillales bacterium]